MTDLSSPEMQRIFKSVRRLNVNLYAVMLLIIVSCIGLAVISLTGVIGYYGGLDWAHITYVVMLAATTVYAVIILILNLRTRKPYRDALCTYVAEIFSAHSETLKGGKNVEIETYLIGDRLCVAKQGSEDLIYFDLTAVKKYYNVCSAVFVLIKKYIAAYYTLTFEQGGYYSVTLTDAINGKPKIMRIVEGGAPAVKCDKNPFVANGYITADGETIENI